jgi:hypothetical protein
MTDRAYMAPYSGEDAAISTAGWADSQGYVVRFVHEPTGHTVEFPAIISNFADTHKPTFGQTHGANMHDPIVTLTKADRKISFVLTIVNASLQEARYNRQCVNLLIQMLYPTLDNDGYFVGKPFINVHLMNLLEGSRSGEGVTCIIESLDYSFNFDEGALTDTEGVIELNRSGKEIYPQSLEISIDAKVVIERGDADAISPLPTNYPSYGG